MYKILNTLDAVSFAILGAMFIYVGVGAIVMGLITLGNLVGPHHIFSGVVLWFIIQVFWSLEDEALASSH